MAFEKGKPRHPNAGRKKGSKNIRKVAKVADVLAEKGINPVEKILEELKLITEPRDAVKVWLDLLSYCQGKPKELPDEDTSDEDLLEEFGNIPEEELLKLVPKPNGAS